MALERLGGSRRFLNQGRVLLGHLIHLRDGLIDLLDTLLPVSYTHLDVYKRQALACTASLVSLSLIHI
ncbi:hypothetical protein [Burkholderia plantarii]|uniref:hypothetical protein n=1 Tax=Burkholderia plantarii TaxID=41899 RepID=UPI001495EAFC